MRVQVVAEYRCGHAPRIISEGDITAETRTEDLRRIIGDATSRKDGLVHTICHCGRGAAKMIIKLDGIKIAENPASDFLNESGSILSIVPDENMN